MPSDNTTPHKASAYDEDVRKTIPFYETLQREALNLVQTVCPEPALWLDTGCGTGYLVDLAGRLFPHTQFVLADPSEAMLTQARQRLAGEPEGRVRFLPPLPSEKLLTYQAELRPQVITALMCHHYLPLAERQAAVQACYTLLDDSGLFITFENIDLNTPQSTQIGLKRWCNFQLEAGRSASAVEAHRQRFKTQLLPITVNEHLALLKSVGFRVVEHFWLSHMQAGFYALK